MVFSSHLFLFCFLPAVLAVYYLLPRRARNLFLALVSYVFYGWANPLFVVLLLFSTAVDYGVGLVLGAGTGREADGSFGALPADRPRHRREKLALAVSLICNLGLLGFFKYFNFGVDSFNAAVAALGLEAWRLDVMLRVVLPLGISFYTFQSMSYTIDVYRGQARPIRNFIDFACFVSMFPQLVAGPIIRFKEVADQLRGRTETLDKFARGALFFSVGLAKKVLLANPCGKVADTLFDGAVPGCLDAWYGVVSYAFQIYFDFSAYTDMAIGLGLMMGFVFPKNFDSPYRSKSITEFWRRWHISLSTWLRDYLYIPLGGNRKGPRRTYINLMLVMLLGGLWHGAAWKFMIWGGMHGGLLALERFAGKRGVSLRLPGALRMLLTFVFVLFTWVFFRAADLGSALTYCRSLLGFGAVQSGSLLLRGIVYKPFYLGTFAAAAIVIWAAPRTWEWTRCVTWPKVLAAWLLLILSVVLLSMQSYNPFIYFIF
jgi:alginate O-acetyltransferase complex protein AlgI